MHIAEELANGIKLMQCIQDLDNKNFELKAFIEEPRFQGLLWIYVVTPVGLPQQAKLIIAPGEGLSVELHNEEGKVTDKLTLHDPVDHWKTAELIVGYLKSPSIFDRYKNADRS